MFVTVLAVLCHLSNPTLCVTEIVTDTSMDDTLTMQGCLMGPPQLARWMQEHPIYRTGYVLSKWKCVIGNKPLPPQGGSA